MTKPRSTHLEHLELRNFRRFERVSIDFHSTLTVLVADNGGGKTALLDGVSIALRHFVDELREAGGHGFGRGDVRMTRAPTGAMIGIVPTSLYAQALIDGRKTSWRRELASMDGKTTHAAASQLAERARDLLHDLRDYADKRRPDPPVLPLIAYYGTGRLWSTHKVTKGKKKAATDLTVQTSAYLDCLSPSSSYGHFEVWFERVVREAQNELQTGIASPHKPQELLAAVRHAADLVLQPSEWANLDWDFLSEELVATHPEEGRLPVSSLSDGIRNLIALIADLAHRAVRLNPHLGRAACQMATGVVLIDEVDMHLHPSWQQTVVGSLQAAFPQVQFIVTTHSHLVVSTVSGACVRIVGRDGTVTQPSAEVEGADSPFALAEVFGVDSAPPVEMAKLLSEYRALVEQRLEASPHAESLRERLRGHFGGTHPVIVALESLTRVQRLKARREGTVG